MCSKTTYYVYENRYSMTAADPIVQSLRALPSCLQKFLQFPRFFAPGYSFWRRTRIHRDPGSKIFFRRAVRCTCKVFNRLARALRDQHYLQTSLHSIELIKSCKTLFRWVSSSKESKVMAVESWVTFHDFRFLYAHIRNNRFENNAKFVKTSTL